MISTFFGLLASTRIAGGSNVPPALGGDITTGLIAYYKFDAGSGTNAVDNGSNNKTGTITDATWETDKPFGAYSLHFNGTSAIVFIDSSDWIGEGNVTVSVWVKIESLTVNTYGSILQWLNAPMFSVLNSAGLGYYVISTTNNQSDFAVSTQITTGAWKHLIITRASDGTVHYYIDNVLADSSTNGGTPSSGSWNAIGAHPTGANWFHGYLKDVRVYSRILTADDRAALFAYTY